MSIQTLKILLWIGPTRGSQHIDLDETMIFFLCIRNHNTTNRWRIIPSKQWHLWCDHVDPTLQSEALWLLNKKYFIFWDVFLWRYDFNLGSYIFLKILPSPPAFFLSYYPCSYLHTILCLWQVKTKCRADKTRRIDFMPNYFNQIEQPVRLLNELNGCQWEPTRINSTWHIYRRTPKKWSTMAKEHLFQSLFSLFKLIINGVSVFPPSCIISAASPPFF